MKILKAAAAAIALAATAGSASAQNLGYGTSGQGTMVYAVGSAISSLLTEKADLRTLVQPQAGTALVVQLVNAGDMDLGSTAIMEVNQAYRGTASFRREQENLRVVGRLFSTRVSFMVREDSNIRSVEDLEGRRITYGYSATPMFQDQIAAALANAGLSVDDVSTVNVPTLPRGADELVSGNADAAFSAVGTGFANQADAAVGIRFLPLNDSKDAEGRMQKVLPLVFLADVEPSPALAGVDKPMKIMGFDHTLYAGAHVPDEVVYQIVKTIAENKEFLVQAFPVFRGFDRTEMVRDYGGLPYHAGAVRYYKEAGLWSE